MGKLNVRPTEFSLNKEQREGKAISYYGAMKELKKKEVLLPILLNWRHLEMVQRLAWHVIVWLPNSFYLHSKAKSMFIKCGSWNAALLWVRGDSIGLLFPFQPDPRLLGRSFSLCLLPDSFSFFPPPPHFSSSLWGVLTNYMQTFSIEQLSP